MNQRKVVLACDHGGIELMKGIKSFLQGKGYLIIYKGCKGKASCDYPDVAKDAIKEAQRKQMFCILICGSGAGMSMVANTIPGIRCVLCSESTTARLSREHNNANVLALGDRIIGIELGKDIVWTFLNTDFSGDERHIRRIDKIE